MTIILYFPWEYRWSQIRNKLGIKKKQIFKPVQLILRCCESEKIFERKKSFVLSFVVDFCVPIRILRLRLNEL